MFSTDRHPAHVALLALVAALLGAGVLMLDPNRGATVAPGTPVAAQAAVPTPAAAATPATAPGQLVASIAEATAPPAPPAPTVVERRGGIACAPAHEVVSVNADTAIRATPGGAPVATLPARSRYLGQPTSAWVQATTPDGRWGRVTLPWSKPVARAGWISLVGLAHSSTRTLVVADLSERRVHVFRGCAELFSVPSAIGRPGSPSPRGRFWVTDRVAVPGAQQSSFGTFAFGLSTVQPNLPAGWTGGDQMAIHGTGSPGSIGQAASAGCLRVGETSLARLRPLLRVGTPVVIQA
ncbi:MAG: ErfK/YbiS/YcfS/YnhG family protein [Thermoleophilia bacterium]|nr:ErfK/YbiS/YcfS/YnhG family protein [Thermoleophilia bacterium]